MNFRRMQLNQRLNNLKDKSLESKDSNIDSDFDKLYDQIGKDLDIDLIKAGYISFKDQDKFRKFKKYALVITVLFVFLYLLLAGKSIVYTVVASFCYIYLYLLSYALLVRYLKNNAERQVYFDTPLFLEELVLLIESGLALFPALQEICISRFGKKHKTNIVRKYILSVYNLASGGIPVSEAFQIVANNCPFPPIKNVLLHLDVSSSVGGELVSALQSLATQVHSEWKLEVENRVKRLENMVVFPVFAAVLGMMLVTAAVPLVPILDFMDSLKSKSSTSTNELGGASQSKIDNRFTN